LFEARKPKGLAIVSETAGYVKIVESKNKREVTVTDPEGESRNYTIPYGSRLKISDGDWLEAGDEITEGSVNPHDILKIKGARGVQEYLAHEVQKVYRLQGVDINDKHIEVIVRQMMRKIKVEDSGDTDMLPGSLVDIFDFWDHNQAAEEKGLTPASGTRVLLGITKASLAMESFLSAASFQETTRVLTDAAIKGKTDPLVGLKENVIIGKLIPAGTGMKRYNDIEIDYEGKGSQVITIDEHAYKEAVKLGGRNFLDDYNDDRSSNASDDVDYDDDNLDDGFDDELEIEEDDIDLDDEMNEEDDDIFDDIADDISESVIDDFDSDDETLYDDVDEDEGVDDDDE